MCHGCHGFELPMAYFDYRVRDELNFRIGRFSPSFGAFNVRHDPANHATSSKPLPYDMGRMLRMNEWNLGVIPSPFPDNGIEIGGTHWFGDAAQLDYAVYAVSGFKADEGSPDIEWSHSTSQFGQLNDNNGRPAGGARWALTLKLGEANDITGGASTMYGTYDPANRVAYFIGGVDLAARLGRTQIRFEYLMRRQSFLNDSTATLEGSDRDRRNPGLRQARRLPGNRAHAERRADAGGARRRALPGRQRAGERSIWRRAPRSFVTPAARPWP